MDETNTLVTAGVEGVAYYKLKFSGATDKKMLHKLDPIGTRLTVSMKLIKALDDIEGGWVKGMRVDTECDILIAWAIGKAAFYKLSDGEKLF